MTAATSTATGTATGTATSTKPSTATKAIIKAEGLVKRFGKFTAVDGVNLEVNAGEVYGFIGPNGAGKSTTIRMLLGILRATAGSASIFGRNVWQDAVNIHQRLAYVPGDVNLWPNLSGGEIIDLFLRMRKGHDKRYKQELIEQFALDPSKKSSTYSKGNRQKVALVAAFSSQADLYILDEPTSGLDPLMERVFQDCVAKVKADGKCIFLSSHILSEVEKLCDRLSIIRDGKIIDTGSLNDLRHLSRNNVTVETTEPLDGLATLAGVYNVVGGGPSAGGGARIDVDNSANDTTNTANNNGVTFNVDNDQLDTVMVFLTSKGLKHLEITPPTLEELFMSHYAGGE